MIATINNKATLEVKKHGDKFKINPKIFQRQFDFMLKNIDFAGGTYNPDKPDWFCVKEVIYEMFKGLKINIELEDDEEISELECEKGAVY